MRFLALALLLAACGVARRPAESPAPSTEPAAPGARSTRDGGPWAFAWRAGTATYAVSSDATIELRGDSLPAEQVRTTTYVTYTFAPEADGAAVQGLVDSVIVEPIGRAGRVSAGRASSLGAPVSFTARLDAGRRRVAFPPLAATCSSLAERTPAGAALVTARDLLVPLPASLSRGAAWRDTVTSTVCRGDLPVATTNVRSYVVEGLSDWEGTPALRVRRTTEFRLSARREGRRPAALEGSGSGTQRLYLDPAGRLLGATGESNAELQLTAGEERGEVRQRSRTQVRLVPDR